MVLLSRIAMGHESYGIFCPSTEVPGTGILAGIHKIFHHFPLDASSRATAIPTIPPPWKK